MSELRKSSRVLAVQRHCNTSVRRMVNFVHTTMIITGTHLWNEHERMQHVVFNGGLHDRFFWLFIIFYFRQNKTSPSLNDTNLLVSSRAESLSTSLMTTARLTICCSARFFLQETDDQSTIYSKCPQMKWSL